MYGTIAKKTAIALGGALLALAGAANAKTLCSTGSPTFAGNDTWGPSSSCSCGIQIGGLVYGYRNTTTGKRWLDMYASLGVPGNQVWAQVWAVDVQGNGAWVYPSGAVDTPGGTDTEIQWSGYPDRSWNSPYYLKAACAD
jgi:hypothetical protein